MKNYEIIKLYKKRKRRALSFVRRRIFYVGVLLREKHENSHARDSGREKRLDLSRPE